MDAGSLVLVYTGNGKGKTTAALGLALRQVGWDRRVLVIQFMKGKGNVYGERVAAERYLPLLEIEQHGRDEFVNLADPAEVDARLAREALKRAEEALASGDYGMVVLDEVNVAVATGMIDARDVLTVLDKRHEDTDVVLTGRYCPKRSRIEPTWYLKCERSNTTSREVSRRERGSSTRIACRFWRHNGTRSLFTVV